jgi:hypothetical protein
MSKITQLDALEILDSRGNPTIEVMATLDFTERGSWNFEALPRALRTDWKTKVSKSRCSGE